MSERDITITKKNKSKIWLRRSQDIFLMSWCDIKIEKELSRKSNWDFHEISGSRLNAITWSKETNKSNIWLRCSEHISSTSLCNIKIEKELRQKSDWDVREIFALHLNAISRPKRLSRKSDCDVQKISGLCLNDRKKKIWLRCSREIRFMSQCDNTIGKKRRRKSNCDVHEISGSRLCIAV